MRHHPKSNNGVFSRKQRKASRFMNANSFTPQSPMSVGQKAKNKEERGSITKMLKSMFRRKAS